MDKTFFLEFAPPGSEYRGAPFWAWNGKLEPDELRRQLRIMGEMGLGGGFMHSRVGLATPYLSKEWFDCIRFIAQECERLDLEFWLYDEDPYPSGVCGGKVTFDHEEFACRFLEFDEHDIQSDGRETINPREHMQEIIFPNRGGNN